MLRKVLLVLLGLSLAFLALTYSEVNRGFAADCQKQTDDLGNHLIWSRAYGCYSPAVVR